MVLDGKSSQQYPVNAGIPEGSILGLTLFLILGLTSMAFLTMLSAILLSMLKTLLSTHTCDQISDLAQQLELASELESNLRDTADWGRKWLVDFNTGKTQQVLFDWSHNIDAIDVKMDRSVLEEKQSFKMLGLTFSSKLDWGPYIIFTANTASKKIGALICSMKFSSSEVVLYLYKSTIQPCMEYCCCVWAGAPNHFLELLDKLLKWICRTVGPSLAASFAASLSLLNPLVPGVH